MGKQEIVWFLGSPNFEEGIWVKKEPTSRGNVDIYFHPKGLFGGFRTEVLKNIPDGAVLGPIETKDCLKYIVKRGENGTREGLDIINEFQDDNIDRLQKANADFAVKASLERLGRVMAEKGAKKKVADMSEIDDVRRKRIEGFDDDYYTE